MGAMGLRQRLFALSYDRLMVLIENAGLGDIRSGVVSPQPL